MSPASRDPEKRARQLANLRGRPPAPEQGNQRATRHGGYSRIAAERLEAKVAELAEALGEDLPVRSRSDALAVAELATKVCQLEDLRGYLTAHGYLTASGDVRPAAELERRLSAQVDDKLDALGLTVRSRAKLQLDLTRSIDLASAMSEPDPELRRALLRRAGVLDEGPEGAR